MTKYQAPGGLATVQVDITLDANTTNPSAKASRSWRGAITRASAATFDSALTPDADGARNIGASGLKWNNGYFSNDLIVQSGRLILGNYTTIPSGMRVFSTGDVGFSTTTIGVILKAPNGTCFRVGVSNSGALTTTSVAICPQ